MFKSLSNDKYFCFPLLEQKGFLQLTSLKKNYEMSPSHLANVLISHLYV